MNIVLLRKYVLRLCGRLSRPPTAITSLFVTRLISGVTHRPGVYYKILNQEIRGVHRRAFDEVRTYSHHPCEWTVKRSRNVLLTTRSTCKPSTESNYTHGRVILPLTGSASGTRYLRTRTVWMGLTAGFCCYREALPRCASAQLTPLLDPDTYSRLSLGNVGNLYLKHISESRLKRGSMYVFRLKRATPIHPEGGPVRPSLSKI